MLARYIEATNGPQNWGKFMVARFDADDWSRVSVVSGDRSLLEAVGWDDAHILVMDLQTGEGAIFRHGGMAAADLAKRRVWVCPLFEPFLEWLYRQDLANIPAKLPPWVDLPQAPFALQGYRREGPGAG